MKGENMTKLKSSESARASGDRAALGRLFVLDLSGNRVFSVNPDGSDRKVIVTSAGCLMASRSMSNAGTSTGPTWAFST